VVRPTALDVGIRSASLSLPLRPRKRMQ